VTIAITPIPAQIAFVAPSLSLTTANAVGSAASAIRSDADVLVYDTTDPTTIAYAASAATGSAATAARRDHTHGMVLSNLHLVGTAAASGGTDLTVTGLSSVYDTYLIAISGIVPENDNESMFLRCGAGSVDSGGTDYEYFTGDNVVSSSTPAGGAEAGAAEIRLAMGGVGSAAGEGLGAIVWLNRPGDSSVFPIFSGTSSWKGNDGIMKGGVIVAERSSAIALDRIQIIPANGNLTSGRLSVYGLSFA